MKFFLFSESNGIMLDSERMISLMEEEKEMEHKKYFKYKQNKSNYIIIHIYQINQDINL